MSIQDCFSQFYKKIKITREDKDYSNAREKDDSILGEIKEEFKSNGYPVIDDFLQGSFSTHTAIRNKDGDFDIDRAIVIDADKAPSNPLIPKKVILEVLEKRGFKNAKIKKPCVTADYSIINLHIDIPLYKLSFGQYYLAIGKANSDENNREWADADPKGLRDWVNSKSSYLISPDATYQQFLRLVCYIKRWRDENFEGSVRKKVFSIGLTVMCKQCFKPSFDENGKPQDLIALKDTVSSILNYNYFSSDAQGDKTVTVSLPVSPWRDIFTGSSKNTGNQLYNKLNTLQNKLFDAANEGDEEKQCTILNKAFGSDFETPTKSSKNVSTLASFSSAGVVGTSQGA